MAGTSASTVAVATIASCAQERASAVTNAVSPRALCAAAGSCACTGSAVLAADAARFCGSAGRYAPTVWCTGTTATSAGAPKYARTGAARTPVTPAAQTIARTGTCASCASGIGRRRLYTRCRVSCDPAHSDARRTKMPPRAAFVVAASATHSSLAFHREIRVAFPLSPSRFRTSVFHHHAVPCSRRCSFCSPSCSAGRRLPSKLSSL